MALKNQDFAIYAGNDEELDISLFGENGDPLDLTGSTVLWVLASAYDPGVALLSKSSAPMSGILITNAVQGMVIVTIDHEDTIDLGGQPYVHEAAVVNVDGATTTVLTGTVTIDKSAV
jgi:hypothetical protein